MFTGLIQGQGEIVAAERFDTQMRIRVRTLFPLPGVAIGESIAVNGACLTVETRQDYADSAVFSAFVSDETLRRTTLGSLIPGARVNLERALAMGERLGGHMVSGHVDAVSTVREVVPKGESRCVTLDFPQELAPEVAAKGSVALDGISLTVNECDLHSLTVNLIPETWRVTTASSWKKGTAVNLETDILGKYVRRCLTLQSAGTLSPKTGDISLELLRDNGFI